MTGRFAILCLAAGALAGCSALPEQASERRTAAAAPTRTLAVARSPEAGQCLARLGRTGAEYTPVPDRYVDQGCAILGTVQLASLA